MVQSSVSDVARTSPTTKTPSSGVLPPVEWVAGFIEGEGCFFIAGHTTKFVLTQSNVAVLELVQVWLLSQGIDSKLIEIENKKKQGCNQLYFYSKWKCKKLYDLIRPHMHHPDKIAQIERWAEHCNYTNSGYGET